jgi:hypothetical protein
VLTPFASTIALRTSSGAISPGSGSRHSDTVYDSHLLPKWRRGVPRYLGGDGPVR